MSEISRRALLAAGAATALSACGPRDRNAPPPTAPATLTPTGSSAGRVPWAQLGRHLDGTLVRPNDAAYDAARAVENPRWQARPLAVARVASAADVATALRFAQDNALEVAIRSGGHSYPGWSAGDGKLVLDCRGLDGLTWQGTSTTMGPGRLLADVYAGVAGRGRALPGGSCPTVGLGGLTLGGGVGVVTRAYGLTCDHLTAAEVVLPDGRILTTDEHDEPDLFWALRGGGGGHLGVTTSMTFSTVPAPMLTTTYLTWPSARAEEVVPAWFAWMGAAPPELWSTLKLLDGASHPDGMSVGATVTWVGDASRFDTVLAPILRTGPTGRYDHHRGFLEAMRAYAGGGSAPQPFAATSHIAYAAYAAPDATAISDLVQLVEACPRTIHEGGVSIDALGGAVAEVAADATAFVHREARATLQYTATWTGNQTGNESGSSLAATADRFVHGLRAGMTPHLGDHAYVNYADASLHDAGTAYFGDNWPRLQQVRASYDPHQFFTQPQ
ncbi:FAD-binding oxidoreductase [Nocardioides jejuensis]|uniref:FAD-binding oxidoreductase n=1 Tax=Nocardioides jejuensis TaxID=2502782 RepID=A0A4R1BYK8_9ACTN|nr:FAD-binding oxidoreductase [Nocardioides jejuensis]TCJ23184.1 FAD-binding oxidoreductase [Nocardioides jejuensis]